MAAGRLDSTRGGDGGLLRCASPRPTDDQIAWMYGAVAARLCGNGGCGRVLALETYASMLHPAGAPLPDHIR